MYEENKAKEQLMAALKAKNCICPKSENGEDIIINFYVYV